MLPQGSIFYSCPGEKLQNADARLKAVPSGEGGAHGASAIGEEGVAQ